MLHSEVKSWFMSPEELAEYREKYPPKMSLKKGRAQKHWKRISKQMYQKFSREGLTDLQIINKYPGYTMDMLQNAKKRWGVE